MIDYKPSSVDMLDACTGSLYHGSVARLNIENACIMIVHAMCDKGL